MQVNLKNVCHFHGKKPILFNINLSLAQGEIGCLVGPSGAGKTTVLNCIAGLETVSDGEIYLNDNLVSSTTKHLPVEERKIGLVFQDPALFPHLNVARNISFGLKGSQADKNKRVNELLEICHLHDLAEARPHELSGGQQQRVALARALAPKPKLLLLDEPFSGADAVLKENLINEITAIIKVEGTTTLMVTHDQMEAFVIADRCGVIDAGSICQWDTVYNIYHRPNCAFVANFIGDGALIDAKLLSDNEVETELGKVVSTHKLTTPLLSAGGSVKLLLRPDDISLSDNSGTSVKVLKKSFRGADIIYKLQTIQNTEIYAVEPSRKDLEVGSNVAVNLHVDHVVVFPTVN